MQNSQLSDGHSLEFLGLFFIFLIAGRNYAMLECKNGLTHVFRCLALLKKLILTCDWKFKEKSYKFQTVTIGKLRIFYGIFQNNIVPLLIFSILVWKTVTAKFKRRFVCSIRTPKTAKRGNRACNKWETAIGVKL